jgi:hypothetical protein
MLELQSAYTAVYFQSSLICKLQPVWTLLIRYRALQTNCFAGRPGATDLDVKQTTGRLAPCMVLSGQLDIAYTELTVRDPRGSTRGIMLANTSTSTTAGLLRLPKTTARLAVNFCLGGRRTFECIFVALFSYQLLVKPTCPRSTKCLPFGGERVTYLKGFAAAPPPGESCNKRRREGGGPGEKPPNSF